MGKTGDEGVQPGGIRIGGEQGCSHIGAEGKPLGGSHSPLDADGHVLLRGNVAPPYLIEGLGAVVGPEDIEVEIVTSRAVAHLESPAHALVLRLSGKGIRGVVIDGVAQRTIESTHAQSLRIILQPDAVERGVHDVGAEGHGALPEVATPILVGRRQAEGHVGIVPVEPVVGEVEGKGHGNTIHTDVQVDIDAIAHGRSIACAIGGVAIRVLRAHGTRDDEGVALGYGGDGVERKRLGRHVVGHGDHRNENHHIVSAEESAHTAECRYHTRTRIN